MEEMMKQFESNMEFIKENISYITENSWIIPMIIEQVALRMGQDPIEYMEETLEMMKLVREEVGPAEMDFE